MYMRTRSHRANISSHNLLAQPKQQDRRNSRIITARSPASERMGRRRKRSCILLQRVLHRAACVSAAEGRCGAGFKRLYEMQRWVRRALLRQRGDKVEDACFVGLASPGGKVVYKIALFKLLRRDLQRFSNTERRRLWFGRFVVAAAPIS